MDYFSASLIQDEKSSIAPTIFKFAVSRISQEFALGARDVVLSKRVHL